MKVESTYNKYKRQNKEMKSILSVDITNFILDTEDWQERISYLKKCILTYRHNKLKNFAKRTKEVKK